MTRPAALIIVLALSWAAPGTASDGDALRLGLDDAVRRAVEVSADLRALEAIAVAADRGVDAAAAGRRPTLDAILGYTRRSSVPEFAVPAAGGGLQTIFPSIENNWIARVEAILPLYTGGSTAGAIDAAGFEREAAARDIVTGEADLVHETRRTYWSLVTAIETERVLRAGLASFDAHLADARNRERFGLAAHNEVLAVHVERERAELARLHAESLAATLEADLVRLIDVAPGTKIDPVEPLDTDDVAPADVESLVATALASRPERAALESRIAAGEASERVYRGVRRPHVALAAGYDYARPNRDIVPPVDSWDDTWNVAVRLSLRMFDGGRTAAEVAQTAARTDALRRQRESLDRRIRLDVTARALDLETSIRALATSEATVASAEENLRIARDRYREGVIPSSELLDAETALLRAGLDRTQALTGVRLARAALDRAIGR